MVRELKHTEIGDIPVDWELQTFWLYGVVEYELISLLKEYWFDEPMKVKDWSENLRSTIK